MPDIPGFWQEKTEGSDKTAEEIRLFIDHRISNRRQMPGLFYFSPTITKRSPFKIL
jgi:hypothetical protein